MIELSHSPLIQGFWLVYGNLAFYLIVFLAALFRNYNFNTILIGLIYLIPMVPLGLDPENAIRVHLVSFQNMLYGSIELVVFVLTVQKTDITFDKEHLRQLFGHTLPIAAALIGLSLVSRATKVLVTAEELVLIMVVFLAGAIMRVLAIYQLGVTGFKFDIAFREEQKLKTNQLYGYMRHPTYTAMMVVILAYALTTHNMIIGTLGVLVAWFGFQFRIGYEERALEKRFREEYLQYRSKTGMWFPKWRGRPRKPGVSK